MFLEYYNKIDSTYMKAVKNHLLPTKIKIEILSHFEDAIGQITNDLDYASGSITINREQGCRRSCSINIIDDKEKYLPNEDSCFWYNRKFKIYLGVCVNTDTYWFSQGVFVTKSATTLQMHISKTIVTY